MSITGSGVKVLTHGPASVFFTLNPSFGAG
jgi:hypothetical protein